MSDLNVIRPDRFKPKPRLVHDCQGEAIQVTKISPAKLMDAIKRGAAERKPDPNDIILRELEMLVAKSDAFFGFDTTNDTLPNRLMLVMAARAVGRK